MPPATAHVVCRVVDNLGDAGVCLRLARTLSRDHGLQVVLWIDDPAPLSQIAGRFDRHGPLPRVDGVVVRRLDASTVPQPWPDLLVEGFGCGLPEPWLAAMASLAKPPLWINLEYLSAEAWVDGAHALPSPHPRLPLRRWFFFPGFTPATGGLLHEPGLGKARDEFLADPARVGAEWAALGLDPPGPDEVAASLFCYPSAPVAGLLHAFSAGPGRVRLIVPQTVGADALARWAGAPPATLQPVTRGALTVVVAPFVPQDAFDRRLWLCGFNIVRGEDSFVRAQWAAHPFAWHVYPQADGAHHAKLEAFLARYEEGLDTATAAALSTFWRAFNRDDGRGAAEAWPPLRAALPALDLHARHWSRRQEALPDLATQLVRFAHSML